MVEVLLESNSFAVNENKLIHPFTSTFIYCSFLHIPIASLSHFIFAIETKIERKSRFLFSIHSCCNFAFKALIMVVDDDEMQLINTFSADAIETGLITLKVRHSFFG
jgi:hypothetical protein